MAQFKITEARLRTIKQRQWKDRWGSDYVAGIWADPKEAPGISTGSILRPAKVGLREFHTLSSAETFASLLVLMHPNCWEVQEQRIMYPLPRPHLLFGHPRASGLPLKQFAGSIEIADRLGLKHPKVRIRLGPKPQDWPIAPFPYFSDLLAYMEDAQGPYVVNISVKSKFSDFRRKGPKTSRSRANEDDPGTVARQQLEENYYASAGIRTQPIGRDQMPDDLCWNLRDLFLDDTYPLEATDAQRREVIEIWRDAIGRDLPAYVFARKIASKCGVPEREATAILRQSIWRRDLRVDLFRPILMTDPLRPEVDDVFVRFAAWFSR